MGQSAYIKFVEGSEVEALSLSEVKEQLHIYQDQTAKTGQQLGWDYVNNAFPYTITTKPEAEGKWFYLKGNNDLYKYIVIGTGQETDHEGNVTHYIQVVLPENCTHGDKNKGNELCKFIARRLKAELQLFNGRIMYFNPRK